MPTLRKFNADWEHRWWPKPMDNALRAELPAFTPGLKAAE